MIKKLAAIGNSYGVIIDRPLLREAGIEPDAAVELMVEDGAVIIRLAPPEAKRARRTPRRRPVSAPNANR
ncbi:MAG: hypothetical protein RIT45_451 [Pseudomonadota bacterium]|jgi:antitoxin component of MazEF toxin-antitoxin module